MRKAKMPRSPYLEYIKNSELRLVPTLANDSYDYRNIIVRVWIKDGFIYKAKSIYGMDENLHWEAETEEREAGMYKGKFYGGLWIADKIMERLILIP